MLNSIYAFMLIYCNTNVQAEAAMVYAVLVTGLRSKRRGVDLGRKRAISRLFEFASNLTL